MELLGRALPDTHAFDGCLKIETFAEEDGKSILLVEEWESKKYQETYFQWCVETGLVDALAPFVSGPPVTSYYDSTGIKAEDEGNDHISKHGGLKCHLWRRFIINKKTLEIH